MSLPPALLYLTDDQLTAIMAMAKPLPPELRVPFFERLAVQLVHEPELGADGVINRCCKILVREYFDAPLETEWRQVRVIANTRSETRFRAGSASA